MKTTYTTIALSLGLAAATNAAITLNHEYHLGEAGSVTGADLLPQDSVGTNHFTSLNASPTVTVIASDSGTPGSTQALQIANVNGGTYHDAGGIGMTDDWALELWVRPDDTGGSYLGATDGDGTAQTGLRFWATNNAQNGTSLGGNAIAAGQTRLLMRNGSGFLGASTSTFTAGTWAQINLIRHNGTVNYYLNGSLQDSAATDGELDDLRLGAGYFGEARANGAFDEMKIWSFDSNVDSLASVEAATITTVPEPSSAALLGLGGFALILRRRK